MDKNKKKYCVAGYFMTRIPLLPANKYWDNYESSDILYKQAQKNDKFLEAVLEANSGLNELSNKGKIESGDKNFQQTLLNYYKRAIMRTTPFGLFNKIIWGEFNEEHKLSFDSKEESYKKFTSTDFQWIFQLIHMLEQDIEILQNLKVKFNPVCYRVGKKLKNSIVKNYGQRNTLNEKKTSQTSILYSKLVDFIIQNAGEYISFNILSSLIQKEYPEREKKAIDEYLSKLIENEYLLTELRTSLNSNDFIQYLVNKIKSESNTPEVTDLICKLEYIQSLILDYEMTAIGEGMELYNQIVREMKSIKESKNYLYSIVGTDKEFIYLPNKIKDELEELGELLVNLICIDNETRFIKFFKKKFLEKYGEYPEIAVQELFDEMQGIGNPYTQSNITDSTSGKTEQIISHISARMVEALVQGSNEISIKKEEIERIAKKYESKIDFSHNFSLNIHVEKQEESMQEYRIKIGPNIGSYFGGDCINRFTYILNDDMHQKIMSVYDEEKQYYSDEFITTNVCELLESSHINNICRGGVHYKHSINVLLNNDEETTNIELKDLYVGYDVNVDRLYIKSKTLDKKIRVVSDNMLNPSANSMLIRLLREITLGYELHPIDSLINLDAIQLIYTPRIRYKCFIIKEEQWKLKREEVNLNSFILFRDSYSKWCERWKVPDLIRIVEEDKRNIIYNNDEHSLHTLKKLLEARSMVTIEKVGEKECEQLLLCNQNGESYYSEIVVPFKLNNANRKTYNIIDKKASKNMSHISRDIVKFMGDDNWVYIKLYISLNSVEDFLIHELKPFIDRIYEDVQEWFFIRYSDPKFHVRLRIRAANGKRIDTILYKFSEWFDEIYTAGFSFHYSIEPYRREVERYGNINTIKIAEDTFNADSQMVINMLQKLSSNDSDITKEEFCLYGCYSILNAFLDSGREMEKLLTKYTSRKVGKTMFHSNPEIYKLYILNPSFYEVERILDADILRKRNEILLNYAKQINEEDELYNSRENIIMSIVHMFCNRFNGERIWEENILALLRYILHKANNYQNYLAKRID